jgi:hypothetical protein
MAEITAGVDDSQAARQEDIQYEQMASDERIATADRNAAALEPAEADAGEPGGGQDGDEGPAGG